MKHRFSKNICKLGGMNSGAFSKSLLWFNILDHQKKLSTTLTYEVVVQYYLFSLFQLQKIKIINKKDGT